MFKASNNEVKYEALIAGIELCYMSDVTSVKSYSNSQLVVSQLNGEYETKDGTMVAYVSECVKLLAYQNNFR